VECRRQFENNVLIKMKEIFASLMPKYIVYLRLWIGSCKSSYSGGQKMYLTLSIKSHTTCRIFETVELKRLHLTLIFIQVDLENKWMSWLYENGAEYLWCCFCFCWILVTILGALLDHFHLKILVLLTFNNVFEYFLFTDMAEIYIYFGNHRK